MNYKGDGTMTDVALGMFWLLSLWVIANAIFDEINKEE